MKFRDPEEGGGALKQDIEEKYGFRPMVTGLFSKDAFYFYTLIRSKDKPVMVPLPEDLSEDGARRTIEAALKRFSPGFLKTVGFVSPPPQAPTQYNPTPSNKGFQLLQQHLKQGYTVKPINLTNGKISEDIDLLVLAAPKELNDKGLFAVDQFVMKGGTVILFTSPYSISRTNTELTQEENTSGLEDWLKNVGISMPNLMVFDPQNESYPIPVQRDLGGFQIQEIRKVPYPPFVDVRSDGMNQNSLITSGIPQVTLSWSSPIEIDGEKTKNYQITKLLSSSAQSWSSKPNTMIPDFETYGQYGFPQESASASTMGVILEGSFSSFFKGKDSPLLTKDETEEPAEEEEKSPEVYSGVINKSPDTARVILFSSNEFLTDQTLQISASGGTSRYMNSLQMMQNALDWALEDRGLLSIRSRGHFSRTLVPLERYEQMVWEYGNYLSAFLGLFVVYLISGIIAIQRKQRHKLLLNELGA